MVERLKGKIKIIVLTAIVVIALLAVGSYFLFRVESIDYLGGEHYSAEELNELIFNGDSPNALLYTMFGDKDKSIPFIQKYDVEVEWPNKMTVTVYEKAIIGYINYMGCNMYFDKDGVVVESSSEEYEGVPEIDGLKFKSIVLNSKLEIGNDEIFDRILELTQAFDKYQLAIDRVYFDSELDLYLYMGDVKINMGVATDYSDRLFVLKQMSEQLSGLQGTLNLEEYDGSNSSAIFKKEN